MSNGRGSRVPDAPPVRPPAAAAHMLESAPAPAWLLQPVGGSKTLRIVRSNTAAGTLPAHRLQQVAARILRSYHKPGPASPFEVTTFQDDCGGHLWLVAIERPVPSDLGRRCRLAAEEWGLTTQQGRVLGLVTLGWCNDEIASELGCAPKTVEHHVHAVLTRTGAQCRAELVACFWTRLELTPRPAPESLLSER